MKKPSEKKELLISGIAGAVLLTGGVVLAISVAPNPFEKFLYNGTGMVIDINGDGQTALDYIEIPMDLPDGYGPHTEIHGYEEFSDLL